MCGRDAVAVLNKEESCEIKAADEITARRRAATGKRRATTSSKHRHSDSLAAVDSHTEDQSVTKERAACGPS